MRDNCVYQFWMLVVILWGVGFGSTGRPWAGEATRSGDHLPGETQTRIRVLFPEGSQLRSIAAHTDTFTAKTGIKVSFDFVPWRILHKQLAGDLSSVRKKYDVFMFADLWRQDLRQSLMPLGNFLKGARLSLEDYPETFRRAVRLNGNIYGLPLRGHVMLLFYRKDVFDRLNLQPPTTWTELEEVAHKIQQETDLMGLAMYYGRGHSGQNLFCWLPLLWGKGASIVGKDGNAAFDSDRGIAATERYSQWLLKSSITPAQSIAWNEYQAVDAVDSGRCAMVFTWSWHYRQCIKKDQPTEKSKTSGIPPPCPTGVAPLPCWEGRKRAVPALCLPVGISAASQNKDEALKYLRWVTTAKLEKKLLLKRSPKDQISLVAVHRSNLSDPDVNAAWNGIHSLINRSLQNARLIPSLSGWSAIKPHIESALHECALGRDVAAILHGAASDASRILSAHSDQTSGEESEER